VEENRGSAVGRTRRPAKGAVRPAPKSAHGHGGMEQSRPILQGRRGATGHHRVVGGLFQRPWHMDMAGGYPASEKQLAA
jgi:hypothetical protein